MPRVMSEDVPRSGDTITPKESIELMRLFAELSDLASQAAELLRGVPLAVALRRLRDLDARIKEKIESIKAIIR